MHGPINVKSPNNTSKWQMGFNSAFKGLMQICMCDRDRDETHNITKPQNKPSVEHTVRSGIVQGIQISVHLGHITAIDL
jgi:hypothetical protein